MEMRDLSNKVLLITGGTGSFGKAVLDRFLKTNIAEIRIFSRDEKKQDDMRHHYRVPADQRDLNYDNYFKVGDETRSSVKEFDSSNTKLMNVVEVKDKLLSLQYIQDELARE